MQGGEKLVKSVELERADHILDKRRCSQSDVSRADDLSPAKTEHKRVYQLCKRVQFLLLLDARDAERLTSVVMGDFVDERFQKALLDEL